MILDAHILSTLQRCPRRVKLEESWKPPRWHPKSLLDATLRKGILELSQGQDVESVTKAAQTRFLSLARDPGLDVSHDPWTLSQDFCAALSTILEKLSREPILAQKMLPPVPLGEHLWRPLAFSDESGTIHRWQTVSRVDADSISLELHSWNVFGELAVLEVPLTLHLIEIGSTRNGRRSSPWSRAFRHPVIPGKFRFQDTRGAALKGGQWKSFYLSDAEISTQSWVDQMDADNVQLVHHLEVKQLSPEDAAEGRRQILLEAGRLSELPTWSDLPTFRTACDSPYPCPFQQVCFGSQGPAELGYREVSQLVPSPA